MAKKNLGRVKRYKSSFYRSRGYHVRRLAIGLAVLAAIFALGWFIGPAVIDFGTSTWYSWKNGSSRSEPVNSDESLSGPMVTETPAPTPTPEPTPTPVGIVEDSRWSWVDLAAVSTEQNARATAQQLAGQGVQYAVLTLKDDGGSLYYASAQELAARSLSEAAIDPAAAVAILKEEGVTAVAQLAMYRDPVAPYTDSSRTAAMSTAASMENVAIVTEAFEEASVTAVVTGGIEVNGGRAGDPASWQEVQGKAREIKQGTINIMVFFSMDLTPAALTRALVTCTEAKTAAIQELVAPSRYSMGLATGSGTDGTILVSNRESPVQLTNAGKHSKLGELIGKAVKQAVKEALSRQSGLNPRRQHQVLMRIDRFGLTEQTLWQRYAAQSPACNRADFSQKLWELSHSSEALTVSALYAHLLDELMWELLSPPEAWAMGQKLLAILKKEHLPATEGPDSREAMVHHMIDALAQTLLAVLPV